MKNKASILGILLFTIISCQDHGVKTDLIYNKEVEFGLGQTIWSNRNQTSVKIIGINDSRCPLTYECFWQGEARVKFRLSNIGTTDFELSTLLNPADTIQGLAFRLVKVEPYPVGGETIDMADYKVTLEVKEIPD
jgi:hypothetical protein